MNKANLFVVGAVKGGTTWLVNNLDNSRECSMLDLKEPHFFSEVKPMRKFVKSVQSEKKYKMLVENAIKKRNPKYIIDGSATYLTSNCAPSKIHGYNPDAKIIMILRNPVERAFSQYLMDIREGYFNQGDNFLEVYRLDRRITKRTLDKSRLYYELGVYGPAIKAYKNLFGDNVKVLFYYDLVDNPDAFVNEVCDFLGIESLVGHYRKSKENSFSKPKNNISSFLLSSDVVRVPMQKMLPRSIREWGKKKLMDSSASKPLLPDSEYRVIFEDFRDDLESSRSDYGSSFYWKLVRRL